MPYAKYAVTKMPLVASYFLELIEVWFSAWFVRGYIEHLYFQASLYEGPGPCKYYLKLQNIDISLGTYP